MDKKSTVIEDRHKKAESLQAMGINLHPAGYRYDLTVSEAIARFGDTDKGSTCARRTPGESAGAKS